MGGSNGGVGSGKSSKEEFMISKLVAYETGKLDDNEVIVLFQHLLDTGIICSLQGHYQRVAQSLLEEGLITRSPAKKVRRRAAKRGPKALATRGYAAAMAAAGARVMKVTAAQRAAWAADEAQADASLLEAARVAAVKLAFAKAELDSLNEKLDYEAKVVQLGADDSAALEGAFGPHGQG